MPVSSWIKAGRGAFASLTLGAMGYQFRKGQQDLEFDPTTYFSFFTIESNITGAAALLWGATSDQDRRNPATIDYLRGATTLYLAITGVVYAALLAGNNDPDEQPRELDAKVVNSIVHQILPAVMTLDWLLVPPTTRLSYKKSLIWLTGPLAFAGYSLVRGPRVDWYPYPFLDPREPGGYKSVAAYSVGIAVGSAAFAWALVALGNWRREQQLAPDRDEEDESPLPESFAR